MGRSFLLCGLMHLTTPSSVFWCVHLALNALSLYNSGITVKECAGHNGLKSQLANISWGVWFEECRLKLWTVVGSKCVSIRGRGLFSRTRQSRERDCRRRIRRRFSNSLTGS